MTMYTMTPSGLHNMQCELSSDRTSFTLYIQVHCLIWIVEGHSPTFLGKESGGALEMLEICWKNGGNLDFRLGVF